MLLFFPQFLIKCLNEALWNIVLLDTQTVCDLRIWHPNPIFQQIILKVCYSWNEVKKLSTKDSDKGFQEYKNFLQNVVYFSTEFKSYDRLEKFFEIASLKLPDSGKVYEDNIMS